MAHCSRCSGEVQRRRRPLVAFTRCDADVDGGGGSRQHSRQRRHTHFRGRQGRTITRDIGHRRRCRSSAERVTRRAVGARAAAAARNFTDAEDQVERALELAPDMWEVRNEAAATYIWQRKYREAIPHYEKCIELADDDRHSCDMLAMAYRALNDEAGARRAAEKMLQLAQSAIERNPSNSSAFGGGANALVMLGDVSRAREWIQRALLIDPDNLNMRYNFACTLIGFSDDRATALDHIEYVFARSVGSIVRRADMDSDLDPIRNDPRFLAIYDAAKERLAKLDAENTSSASTAIG